jgi:hypothetical protein
VKDDDIEAIINASKHFKYISLASFIADDDVDFLESADTKKHKRKVIRIYNGVFRDFEKMRKEIAAFDPFELPTDRT